MICEYRWFLYFLSLLVFITFVIMVMIYGVTSYKYRIFSDTSLYIIIYISEHLISLLLVSDSITLVRQNMLFLQNFPNS